MLKGTSSYTATIDISGSDDPVSMNYLIDSASPTFLSDHVLRDHNDDPIKDTALSSNGVYTTRPYLSTDTWNTPIPVNATVDPDSATYVAAIWGDTEDPRRWNLNPNQYAYGMYIVSDADIARTVTYTGVFSDVSEAGVLTYDTGGGTAQVPIPLDAMNSQGSDSSIIIIKPSTGEEWGFWRLTNNQDGSFSATNGYHTYTTRTAYQPNGFGSRGGGLTYMAGIIRPHEVLLGEINHALAFAYDKGLSTYIPPVTTKSDGSYVGSDGLPYGARIRLDPTVTEATIRSWAVNATEEDALYTICRALQVYGAYLIDYSGSVKLITEDNLTARWSDTYTNRFLTARTLRNVPTLDVIQVLTLEGVTGG
jgi:hypothetical protein